MEQHLWLKQPADKSLFPDLLWSRPENRALAGKLLIIGGNSFGFAAPAEAYSEAVKAGVGIAHVLLPDATKRLVGQVLETGDYAPSTPSGSFSQNALGELLPHAAWADGVLLAGDFGRNSETAVLLEKFISSHHGQLTITKDAADYFTPAPQALLARPETTLVVSLAQLQKLAMNVKFPHVFTFSMDLIRLVEALHELTLTYPVNIIVKHLANVIVASGGQVSTTKLESEKEIWRVATAGHAAVWWLQNPNKPFEALTTAVYETANPAS